VRHGIYDVDYAHHYQVHPAAEISCYRAVYRAYDEHEHTGHDTDEQRNAAAHHQAHHYITPMGVGPEDMREYFLPLGYKFEFLFRVFHRGQVFAPPDLLFVRVGVEYGPDKRE